MRTKQIFILIFLLVASSILKAQTPPTATSVAILGEAYVYNTTPDNKDESTTLTGKYTYSGDNVEGSTTFQWYRNTLAIAGATSIRYKLTDNDLGQNITFGVIPIDNLTNPGTEAITGSVIVNDATTPNPDYRDDQKSNWVDETGGTINYLNIQIKDNDFYTIRNGTTVHIYGDLSRETGASNKVTLNIWDSSSVIIHGQFIATDDMEINVSPNSSLTIISGLDARDGASLAISGNMDVTGDITVVDNATFTIADGGSMAVAGDFIANDNAVLNIEGAVTVGGDLTVGTGGTINVDLTLPSGGSLAVTGGLTGGAGTVIEGVGPVSVGGIVDPPALAGDNQILPIELTYFKASLENNYVVLNWQTASEENNDYFTIERSTNAVNFEETARINGAGNSTVSINYSYIDETPAIGINYYRLKQTDYNGDFTYSDIETVANLNSFQFEIGPNPASNFITISSPVELSGTIKILSNTGGQLLETSVSGQSQIIDISNIRAGQYLVIFNTGKGVIAKKLRVE